MSLSTLLWRNLAYYWRTNLAVVLGVATAVAVLAGALLVGDSVRSSLRELVLGRLGRTDSIVAGTGFFRAALAGDLGPSAAYAMIAVEGVVTHTNGRAASKVAVYGVDEDFWKFHGVALAGEAPTARGARLSPALSEELAAAEGDAILLRLDKPSEVPLESLHGRKEESVRSVRFTAGKVLPVESLGEFALRPRQGRIRALFVPLARLQRELQQPGKANVVLIGAGGSAEQLKRATLEDLGIRLKPLEGQFSVETSGMVVNTALEQAVTAAAAETGAKVEPVLTYLVNSLRANGREVPYSLVTAHQADGLVLNDWTARELAAKPGDTVSLEYFMWQDGRIETRSAAMPVSAVVPIRGAAADRDFAPEYPGITAAKTIHDWDPPFPLDLNRIRKQDEDYWDRYRTTPKAFLPIAKGQQLWGSRFGNLTSMRVSGVDREAFARALRARIDPQQMGLSFIPVRADGLAASRGATDFGEYFIYFSFFLVVSALLLVGLFFRLGIEQRYREAGLLRALGFPVERLSGLFLREGAILAAIGCLAGALAAAAYAGLILYGLRTWWIDAVGTTMLRLHLAPLPLAAGAIGGMLTALAVIYFTVRQLRAPSPRALMQGNVAQPVAASVTRARSVAVVCSLLGLACLGAALAGRMNAAGGFFGAGALFLIAAIAAQRLWIAGGVSEPTTVWKLGLRNAAYRPGRSILSIALIAFATFLILSLTAFRQEGASNDPARRPGTGGFALVGESAMPVIYSPALASGRAELSFPASAESLLEGTRIVPLRLRPGDDASCLNLYTPGNPRVVGVPASLIANATFPLPGGARWDLLNAPGDTIPAFADANSLQYVLHKSIGDEIEVGGAKLRIAGALADSIFQGELLVSEENFKRAFAAEQGYRLFLIQAPAARTSAITQLMEDRLSDYGLDLQSTVERLNEFHRVENAYLSTFQALGGLGLLLGTIGLGAVLLRNVLERRKELALLRAVGYRPKQLTTLVVAENALLLAAGLSAGALCAALAIAPALIERGRALPLAAMAALVLAVFLAGMVASFAAVRAALKSPLLAALRSE